MKPVLQKKPPEWMIDPDTARLMKVLNGGEGVQALFVGGCVRNWLMDRVVEDIDIATKNKPQDIIEKLERNGIKSIPTGIEHGTITAVINKKSFEITSLRKDIETDGRHAEVLFTEDWVQDAKRRDFTMNTLLASIDGNIYDPLGQGLKDLKAEKILFVGDAEARIREDYLRILRFFRFHAYYGSGAPDARALKACAKNSVGLEKLSKERVTQEFLKILHAPDPTQVLSLMLDHNVLTHIFGYGDLEIFQRFVTLQSRHDLVSAEARFFMLCLILEKELEKAVENFSFSNQIKKKVSSFDEGFYSVKNLDEKSLKRLAYMFGKDVALQVLLMRYALGNIQNDSKGYVSFLERFTAPVFPLKGQDLIDLGIPNGPERGKLLKNVECWWIENDFKPSHAECLKKLKMLVG